MAEWRDSREVEGFLVDFQPMSPEEMQRMMQFLLNQQAQFDANQGEVRCGVTSPVGED
jgi:hypothetical protein